MNKISRLTALLLVLMMSFSTFAAAEAGYQIGGITQEQWESLVNNAEDKLYIINEGDAGKEIVPDRPAQPAPGAYYPYLDSVTKVLADETITCQITASGVAVLTNAAAGQWQMKVGGVWADIIGETGDSLYVTGAMMNGMTVAEVRKALEPRDGATGEYTAFTATGTVEIVETVPAALESVSRAGVSDDAADKNAPDEVAVPYSLERANEGLEKHLITINYIFQSNLETAANPYFAEVSTNKESFSAVVRHPSIRGYQPAANAVAVDEEGKTVAWPADFAYSAEAMSIAEAKITGDITINVYYEPAMNKFVVKYWEELAVPYTDPATGELVEYAQVEGITAEYSGYTEAPVKDSYPYGNQDTAQYFATLHVVNGFKPLMYDENIEIAANGSTVVNVYYQRLYYLIAFELEGGYGTNPIYTKYGVELSEVTTPTRPGYVFKGWTDTQGSTTTVDLPKTMPIGGKTYYAVWEAQEVSYSVAYWLEDPNWVDTTPDDATDNVGQYAYLDQEAVTAFAGTMTNVEDQRPLPGFISDTLDVHLKRNISWAKNSGNVEVAGDGSTIVNVYYNRKEYDLRFYYAMSHEVNGATEYKVVGGTTYYFGSDSGAKNNADEISLLQQYSKGWGKDYTGQTGVVDNPPTVKNEFADVYIVGSTNPENDEDEYTYHYIQFSAKYGANISELWPVDVFNSVSTSVNTYWPGDEAFVAGWNGEYYVYYSQHNSNETIKGAYDLLDHQLLWDYDLAKKYGDGNENNEVAFLCFWENGANITWSVPELYRYHIYVEAMPGEAESATDVWYGNKRYVRKDAYDTIDNSTHSEQTDPAITGLISLAVHGSDNKLTGGYDHVQVVADLQQTEVVKDRWVTYEYKRAKVSNATANKFKTIQAEIDALELYYDADGNGVLADNEPLYNDAYFMYFYYDRQKFSLVKNNVGVASAPVEMMYEQSLNGLGDMPAYPDWAYPEGGYEFEGWYSSATFEPDTKVDFNTATMPASNMTIYAKWVPIYHSVRAFNTMAEAQQAVRDLADGKNPTYRIYEWIDKVAYGSPTSSAFTFDNDEWYDKENQSFKEPVREGYNFTLWFYLDENGDPQPFSFGATPITRDTIVFAGWTADAYANYRIYYVKQPEDAVKADAAAYKAWYENPDNWVADPYDGNGLAGAYVTEKAKGGIELKMEYREKYFPTVESNSFFLEELEVEKNVCVFEYVWKDEMPYTVHYVTEKKPDNGNYETIELEVDGATKPYYKLLDSKKVADNIKAVVTENYEPVGGNYVPDAFQKRLILSADRQDAQIVFFYTEDETRTTLEVKHYKVYADGTEEEYNSEKSFITLPSNVAVEPENIDNYEYVANRTTRVVGDTTVCPSELTFEAKTGSEGIVVKLYYVEKTVTINYVPVGPDNAVLTGEQLGTIGSVTPVVEEHLGVATGVAAGSVAAAGVNYTFDGWYRNAECTELISQQAAYVPTKVNGLNAEATYYAKFVERTVTITYVAALREGSAVTVNVGTGGLVDLVNVDDTTAVSVSETFGVLTGRAEGATATASSNHKFVGWYADETCSGTPVCLKADYTPAKNGDVWTSATYYALFELDVADMVITKQGLEYANESAIVDVVVTTDGVDTRYTLVLNSGNTSAIIADIPIGSTYTVAERNSWTWLYNATDAQSGTIAASGNTVIVSNTPKSDKWLHDESYLVNNVGTGTSDGENK